MKPLGKKLENAINSLGCNLEIEARNKSGFSEQIQEEIGGENLEKLDKQSSYKKIIEDYKKIIGEQSQINI